MLRIFVRYVLSVLFLLTSCGPDNQAFFVSRGLPYVAETPLKLRVSRIETLKSYVPSKKSPAVDHLFPTPPLVMLEQWIKDRFIPCPGSAVADHALITIEDASVVGERREGAPVLGLWRPQSDRYRAHVSVRIDVIDQRGYPKGHASASANLSRTIPSSMTVHERHRVWSVLAEELVNNINKELERNVRRYLGNVLEN